MGDTVENGRAVILKMGLEARSGRKIYSLWDFLIVESFRYSKFDTFFFMEGIEGLNSNQ